MDNGELLSKSIFDMIEERSESPSVFVWSRNAALFNITPENFLFEGELITIHNDTPKLRARRYVLTINALIKYKKSDSSIPKEALKLKNPRIEKIEDKEHDLYGFRLFGYKNQLEFYAENVFSQDEWVEKLRKVCISFNLSYRYSFDRLLGKGSFARVHKAIKKRDGKEYAIKTIEKAKIFEHTRNLQSMEREIETLRMLSHPGIIKFYEVYENDLYIHIVLEYLRGGELFQQLQSKGIYSEKDAALVFKCVLEALAYCHERNVIHRDLKPENLILTGTLNKWDVKIADFGLATVMDPEVPEKMRCGSPGYVAPEVLNNLGYDTKADIFSAGIILFVILTGASPFYGKNYHEVLMKNKEGSVVFVDQYWKLLGSAARDITEKMVAKDPAERITAKEALKHPWFSMEHTGTTGLSTAQENMRKYNDKNRFNMEKIKPEFSMVTCSPLLNARGTGAMNSPYLAPGARRAFVAQSPMPLPSKLVKDANDKEESKKVVKGGLLIRSLLNKGQAEAPKLLNKSSFRRKQEQEEDDGDFKDEDIDEQPVGEPKGTGTKAIHKAFVPRVLEDRKLPATPGFHNTNAFAYLKSIATPMQNRRTIMKKKVENNKSSYFKRIAEATNGPTPQEEVSQMLPSRNDPEFQTAMSHPDVDSIKKPEPPSTEDKSAQPPITVEKELLKEVI